MTVMDTGEGNQLGPKSESCDHELHVHHVMDLRHVYRYEVYRHQVQQFIRPMETQTNYVHITISRPHLLAQSSRWL